MQHSEAHKANLKLAAQRRKQYWHVGRYLAHTDPQRFAELVAAAAKAEAQKVLGDAE